jgi:hypothetical protein
MRAQVGIRFARNVRFAILLGCPLIATAWMSQPAAGQSELGSGRVEGVIVDESDGVVPDAAVTASSDAKANRLRSWLGKSKCRLDGAGPRGRWWQSGSNCREFVLSCELVKGTVN